MSDQLARTGDGISPARGTAGYAETADVLAVQYEEVTFDEVHRDVLQLVPVEPGRILDVGAGTGRDAAALASRGHSVVAVEPTVELRAHGQRIHADSGIDWVDDVLPDLTLSRHTSRFDAVFATAVWMHLNAGERRHAMARIARLLVPGGRFFVNLRHGPVPDGRHMFDVSAAETAELGGIYGLRTVHRSERPDLHGRDGVRWSHLVLQTNGADGST
ncbi:bifunctional 2-polyprenyl-6-hydroxyphenol methylase/3-demethylubiquinol 3-O-methyltransferase UbiG [Streptomyces sp. NBC_01481]|uniref:class I SAM-dependent methyltransferase n=1 Tax=Streptomyces sp. NBC_01481 TaxID=2975869 RepID=UPI00225C0D55|nr:class I SAM-dependent methyltransferase [Streptomyces sp. NBC_01481]MCX4582680.1 class I SAM-dependent methyltransferase [Streptomyces sp. NBC_01481]